MSRSHTGVTDEVAGPLRPVVVDPVGVDPVVMDPVVVDQGVVGDAGFTEACPITEVIDHVAGKWSVGILVAAASGPIRFTELERTVQGISRRMLTLNLRKLERDGLLVRTVYPTVPPKVDYRLTPMAHELRATLLGLVGWAERYGGDIVRARTAYDARDEV